MTGNISDTSLSKLHCKLQTTWRQRWRWW